MQCEGKYILLTGAGKGLGEALAHRLVREGASLCFCARTQSDVTRVHQALLPLKAPSAQILALTADIADRAACNALLEQITTHFPRLDALINNAGISGTPAAFDEGDFDDWEYVIRVNLIGLAYLCHTALPLFKAQRHGKIINLSGGGATAPLPHLSAYAASKAAIVRLTETLAEEMKDYNIDINAVAPGALNTEFNQSLLARGETALGAKLYHHLRDRLKDGGTPLNTPIELILYLLDKQSNGISGKLISAAWDPWQTLHEERDEIMHSDRYTLRRV